MTNRIKASQIEEETMVLKLRLPASTVGIFTCIIFISPAILQRNCFLEEQSTIFSLSRTQKGSDWLYVCDYGDSDFKSDFYNTQILFTFIFCNDIQFLQLLFIVAIRHDPTKI